MRIAHVETLISSGSFPGSPLWSKITDRLHEEILSLEWPIGAKEFLIYPECGKKRGMGNGVKPIKNELMIKLSHWGWHLEKNMDIATVTRPGKIDAVLSIDTSILALEWETGNVSSSHRALNKMCLGMLNNYLTAGILIVPTKAFAYFLTDRVGNYEELKPYFPLWSSVSCFNGLLQIIAIEHDGTSENSPRIPKGTDGRALA